MGSVETVRVVIMKRSHPAVRGGANRIVAAIKSHQPFTRIGFKVGLAAMGLAISVVVAGCSSQKKPLQVSVTQLGPYSHAAKAPDCQMPVLRALPVTNLTQIA